VDYTTVALVKSELRVNETTDDTLLATLITAASRAIDRHCTGVASRSDDYFKSETITDELLTGQVNREGNLLCWPHKPVVTTVSALSYRYSPRESWIEANLDYVELDGGVVTAWMGLTLRKPQRVKISYTGGVAADVDGLPSDFVEAVTVMAGRFYREAEGGLNDSIGVADLGMLFYTKAIPVRVKEMLIPYKRVVGW